MGIRFKLASTMTVDEPKQDTPDLTPVRFLSFLEITARPKWQDGLDTGQHKLLRIIGDYDFPKVDEVQCGLKGCGRIHMRGYVVETVDGLETHIGNRCGKNHFNVNWGEIRSAFYRAKEDRIRQEWLDSVLAQRDTLLSRSQSLLHEVDAAKQGINGVLDRLRKEAEIHSIFMRAVRNGGLIQVEKTIDKDTAEAMNLSPAKRRTLETVGRIMGIEVIPGVPGALLGDLVADKLRTIAIPMFTTISASTLKNLNKRQSKSRAKDINNAKLILQEAETYITTTKKFLQPSNLRVLGKLPATGTNTRTERILNQFASTPDQAA